MARVLQSWEQLLRFQVKLAIALSGAIGDTFADACCNLVHGVTKLSLKPSSFATAFRLESRFEEALGQDAEIAVVSKKASKPGEIRGRFIFESPSREYVYTGGKLLAKLDSSGTKYYHRDHLSSECFSIVDRRVSVRDSSFMAAPSGGLARIAKLAALSVLLVLPALAQAQESSGRQEQQNQQQQATTEKKEKEPPPPVFSRHRRGIYKNALGVAVVDATPQSPPLGTDDPGVPDKGEYEINLTTRADFSKELRTFDFFFVDANYGILPKVFGHALPTQVKFEFPLAGAKVPGDPMRVGIGAAKFGLKLNFYNNEHKGVYISLYPQIEFAVPGANAVEKGLAEPGQTLILPLLVQKEFKYLTFVANGIIEQPIHDPARNTTGTWGFGFGRAITRHTAAMAEIRFTSTFDLQRERLLVVNSGLMRRIRDNVVLYATVGRSVFSDDGIRHIYVGVGVKFLLTPDDAAGKK